jgi:hypothetical protein
MRYLKTLAVAATLAAVSSQAVAGGFAPVVDVQPVTPVEIIEPTPQRSTFGILLPLALLGGLVALAVAADES